jgi:hypothetical protein
LQHALKTKRAELLLLQSPDATAEAAAAASGEEGAEEKEVSKGGEGEEARKARFKDAKVAWRELMLSYSCENYHSHRGYMCALLELDPTTCSAVLKLKALDLAPALIDLTHDQRQLLTSAYEELAGLKPRSRAVKRIPLTFLEPGSAAHTAALAAYMTKMIKDGMPALAADLSGLYTVRPKDHQQQQGGGGSAASAAGVTTALELMVSDCSDKVDGRQASSHPSRFSGVLSSDKDGKDKAETLQGLKMNAWKRCKEPSVVGGHPVFLTVLKVRLLLLLLLLDKRRQKKTTTASLPYHFPPSFAFLLWRTDICCLFQPCPLPVHTFLLGTIILLSLGLCSSLLFASLQLAQDLLSNLKATGVLALPSDDASAAAAAAAGKGQGVEPPTCELWLLYLLAQLEEARGCYGEALKLIDQAIQHTPTAVRKKRSRC